MPIKKHKQHQKITCPAQLRAISSPIRNAIQNVILNQGEASIREIAHQLGMKPASLYRHIDVLVESGIIIEEGTVSTDRRDAKVYSSTREYIEYQPNNPEMLEALSQFIRQNMKASGKQLIESTESGSAVVKGDHRTTYFSSLFSWLDDDQLCELNEHINAIADLMIQNERRPGTQLVGLTIGMYPRQITENTK